MVRVLEKPIRFIADNEEDHRDDEDEEYNEVAHGDTWEECLKDLVDSINQNIVDDVNNELIIVDDGKNTSA